jgi:tRNA-dependent cyclodipeptide synthase
MNRNNAFIGVSLDSRAFSREWVRSALGWILSRHGELLIVIADELLYYTRTSAACGDFAVLDFNHAKARVESRRKETENFFRSEIDRLLPESAERVRVVGWDMFSDHHYSRLLRMIRIGFESIPGFRSLVCELAVTHVDKVARDSADSPAIIRLCADFILDEIAMCLRITELAGFSSEYYPGDDISVLGELCAGRWSKSGLSVESLLGTDSKRKFTRLKP